MINNKLSHYFIKAWFFCLPLFCNAQQKEEFPTVPVMASEELLSHVRALAQKTWPDDDPEINPDYSQDINFIMNYKYLYAIDINNDGKNNYVFFCLVGSVKRVHLIALEEKDGILNFLDQSENLSNEDTYIFFNPLTDDMEPCITVKGKTYIIFEGEMHSPSFSLWEQNKISHNICDAWCINYVRNLFNQLYQKRLYKKAFNLLYAFEKSHRDSIPKHIDLWMRNDCALAAIRDNRLLISQEIILSIKSDPAFLKSTESLIRAVTINEKIAKEALVESKKGTRGKCDYSLLSVKGQYGYPYIPENTIDMVVPNIVHPEGRCWKTATREFFSPYKQKNITKKDHYVLCDMQTEYSKAFMWCDTQEQISILASDDYSALYVTSNSVLYDKIPQEFYDELYAWIKRTNISYLHIFFYDRYNKVALLRMDEDDCE